MSKDFDTERRERHAEREMVMGDRTFVLGGETFTYRVAASYTVLEDVADTADLDGRDLIRSMEQAAIDMLEPGQGDRFLAVVRSKEDPLTFEDLNNLCQWLTEAQVGRPTPAPSLSTPGGAAISTPSTDDSSSVPAEASAA